MQRRKIKNRQDADACLAAAGKLALSPTDWARANGVDGRSLNHWRLAIAGSREPAPLRLLELVSGTAETSAARSYTVRCGAFEIEAPRDFDDAVLGRLLRVVASAC